MKDVTGNLEEIYQLMFNPMQKLEDMENEWVERGYVKIAKRIDKTYLYNTRSFYGHGTSYTDGK